MNILFYWFYIAIQVVGNGSVYATGEYRKPLSDNEFSRDEVAVKWTIAGQDSLSSCYAWAMADAGYEFAGFYADSLGQTLLTTEAEQARLWAVSDSAKTENGIVSGRDFYPAAPTATVYAIFRDPTIQTGLENHSEVPNGQAEKVLREGEVLIRTAESTYHLSGQQ